jgi:nitroreductase
MPTLDLTPDQLLTTTRAVRKRLDFDRPVEDDVIRECVRIAMQAPSGSNLMTMQFVIVTDPDKRAALGEIYRQCYEMYKGMDGIYAGSIQRETEVEQAQQDRVASSADYLGEHLGEAPALVIPCNAAGRTDGQPGLMAASTMANVLPAMWSFMLAARARGLGTAWTTVHLMMEQQAAEVLGVPYDEVQQLCLSPLAYTKGTDFKPAMRPEPDTIIHWNGW